jgi:hydrocephalus-inducing protein
MKIIWARQGKKEKKKPNEAKDAKNDSKASTLAKEKEPEEPQVFTITPAEVMLNAKMGIMVEIRANAPTIGKLLEQWQCQILVGNERKPKPVYFCNIFGNFITPTLQFNNPKVDFKYLWQKGVPSMPISKDLTIKNTSPL